MPSELAHWSDLIASAEHDFAQAEQVRLIAEQRRANSLRGRLLGWLGATPVAQPQTVEAVRLRDTRSAAKTAAEAWVRRQLDLGLSKDLAFSEQHATLVLRRDEALARWNLVRPIRRLAYEARYKLDRAADACSNAASMEAFDAMSSSAAISLMSTAETSGARSALREAQQAVQDLSDAIPKKVAYVALVISDDLLDLVLDLAVEPDFDFLSWSNMTQLQDVAEQCRQTWERLGPLHDRIRDMERTLEQKFQQAERALYALEEPLLKAAVQEVPPVIGLRLQQGVGVSRFA